MSYPLTQLPPQLGPRPFNHGQSASAEHEYDRLRNLARQAHDPGTRHQFNKQASEFIFRENNAPGRVHDDEIDLHGQFVEEAEEIVEQRIRYAQSTGQTHLHAGRIYVNLQGNAAQMPSHLISDPAAYTHHNPSQYHPAGHQSQHHGGQGPQHHQHAGGGNDEIERAVKRYLPKTEVETTFNLNASPRYVRLSDSALGLVVRLRMPILLRYRFYPLDFVRSRPYLRQDRRVFGHAWLTEGRPTLFSGSVLWGSRDEEEAVKWMTPVEVNKWGLVLRTEHTVEVLPAQRTGAPLLTEEDNLFQPAGGGQPILPAHQNQPILPANQDQLLLPASQSQPFLSPEGNYHLPLTTVEDFQPLPGMSTDEYQRFLPTGQNQPVLPTQEDHTLPLTIDEYLGSFSAVPTDQDRAFLPA
ncbi:MAG: hypothetical protein LQ341_004811 [Variospora aurantia]|nr:MAG: hypothetical protein LQ341_004811 [Variospora aurantia]